MQSAEPLKPPSNRLLYSLIAIVAGMLMLVSASVPIYDLFCRVTGYGGTTAEGTIADVVPVNYPLNISFNADVDRNLPWSFAPIEQQIDTQLGVQHLTAYTATNNSNKPIIGTATYNVTPHAAGQYFYKIQCFCFEEQLLKPNETMHMPVSFMIDPAFKDDPSLENVHHITLSYSFFPIPGQ